MPYASITRFVASSRPHQRNQRGQALIEFALTIPLLIIIMLACLELSLFVNSHVTLANAVREGTRNAALGRQVSSINSRIISLSGRLKVTSDHITVERSSDDGVTWSVMTIPTSETGGTGKMKINSDPTSSFNEAKAGDLVRVTVNIPYSQITNFLPGLNGTTISKSMIMRREPT